MDRKYTIHRIDGADDSWAEELHTLHTLCFGSIAAPKLTPFDLETGAWWLAFADKEPVAFAGIMPARTNRGYGYLCRVGVLPFHRGAGLQRKLIRVRERFARDKGYLGCITDTTPDNFASANSLIAEGYRLFAPATPWALSNSLYWRKTFIQ